MTAKHAFSWVGDECKRLLDELEYCANVKQPDP